MRISISNTVPSSRKASSAWSVSDISGLDHWFKYQTNFTLSGSNVTDWGDNHGSNNFYKVASSGNIPYNSGDVDFDANGGRMALDTLWDPGSFSFYFVFRINYNASSNTTIFNEEIINSGNFNFIRLNNGGQVRIRIGDNGNNDINLTNSFSLDTWHVLGVEWDGTTINLYQDSKYDSASGTNPDTDTFAGISHLGIRSNQFDGNIRELVFINQELSSSDRNNLMEHLIAVKDL